MVIPTGHVGAVSVWDSLSLIPRHSKNRLGTGWSVTVLVTMHDQCCNMQMAGLLVFPEWFSGQAELFVLGKLCRGWSHIRAVRDWRGGGCKLFTSPPAKLLPSTGVLLVQCGWLNSWLLFTKQLLLKYQHQRLACDQTPGGNHKNLHYFFSHFLCVLAYSWPWLWLNMAIRVGVG